MCEELTRQQEAFIQGLMQGKEKRQAYIDAYPKAANWKPGVASVKANELAKKPNVAARLRELRGEAEADCAITRDAVVDRLKTLAFKDLDMDKLTARDQLRALELLAKILGYLDGPQQASGPDVEDLSALKDLLRE